MPNLERFKDAQNSPHAGFEAALRELRLGQKRGHWIWYIFPQLSGLGRSELSRAFAIQDKPEAIEYLQDDELRERLLRSIDAVLEQVRRGMPLRELMGSDIDALKIVSSLTLFSEVAGRLASLEHGQAMARIAAAAGEVLAAAERQGYPRCACTLRRLQGRSGAAQGNG